MKPDYKNWVPMSMVWGFSLAAAVCCAGAAISKKTIKNKKIKNAAGITLALGSAGLGGGAAWLYLLNRTFSYNGKRQMSKQIIEGVSDYVSIPRGGKGLDVGCGSGALTIACAEKNKDAVMVGCDIWSGAYKAVFTKELCEQNAAAEGVNNVSFEKGNALSLPYPDESFDAVTSNYVYHNIPSKNRQDILLETLRVLKKGGTFALHDIFSKSRYGDMNAFVQRLRDMGYEKVELIDTTDGKFMSRIESVWMDLSGSALLTGRK